MTTPVWISLGSNLGDRRAILDQALVLLGQTPGVTVATVSSSRETRPVGGPAGQGPFLNAAARLDTTLSPRELLGALQAIEHDLGRVRTVRWGERTLDLDILIYGSKFVDEPDLKVPHPRLAVRRFVLEPLAEIAPDTVDTITRRPVGNLLAGLNHSTRCLMLDESIVNRYPSMHERLAAALEGVAVSLRSIEPDRLTSALNCDTWSRFRADLSKAESWRASAPSMHPGDGRWQVCNFALDVTRARQSCTAEWLRTLDEATIARAAVEGPKMWYAAQIGWTLVDLCDATLIVAFPDSRRPRKPGISHTPIYWPEATESEAIVAEVVAVCWGIEGL